MSAENFDRQAALTPTVSEIEATLQLAEDQTGRDFFDSLRYRGRLVGAVGGSVLAFAGGVYAAGRVVENAAAAPQAAAAGYNSEDTTTPATTTGAPEATPTTTTQPADGIDKKLFKQCEASVLYGAIDSAGYDVLGKRKVEWSLVATEIDPKCLEYGKWTVQLYAVSYAPKDKNMKRPTRLGKTITYKSPVGGKLYEKRQTLNRPIPARGEVTDAETTIWMPKAGLGKPKRHTRFGWGTVDGR